MCFDLRDRDTRLPRLGLMASARAWPCSMLDDSDVLRLDTSGRFVICRVCCLEYAVYGGREPERVDMGLPFFTHEWIEHKRLRHGGLAMIDDQRVGNRSEATQAAAEPLSLAECASIKQEDPAMLHAFRTSHRVRRALDPERAFMW